MDSTYAITDHPVNNPEAAKAAADRQSMLTKPLGALGYLEELSIKLAGMTGNPAAIHQERRHRHGCRSRITMSVSAYLPKSPPKWYSIF